MSQISLNEYQIKSIFKAAIVEVLEERQDLLAEVLEEVLENIGLITAMKAGEESEEVGWVSFLNPAYVLINLSSYLNRFT